MPRRKKQSDLPSLFDSESAAGRPEPPAPGAPTEYAEKNRERLHRWASRGIFFGSSSWKYPGWEGIVYNRPYPSKKAFEQECITEYAELFPTVCADFALYDFPDADRLMALHDRTPELFTISLKVTDRITIKRYPNLPRHGAMAGKDNPDFLNVELFEDAFLRPLEALRAKRGVVIFEFSTFHPTSGVAYDTFMERLDRFLAQLPRGVSYAVEIRNSEYLTSDYFALLTRHGVAHVLNSWTRMPPIMEQTRIAGVLTGGFSVARALLRPGRTYREAVEKFQPYDRIREENPELRLGLADAVQRCIAERKQLYAYVNNRAEGNSPKTIEAILDVLDHYPEEKL